MIIILRRLKQRGRPLLAGAGAVASLALVTALLVLAATLADVRAQVEDATFVTPSDLDFGVTLMEQRYDAACDAQTDPTGASGNCMSIHLSASFMAQTQFSDVEYDIFCEDKPPGNPHRADGNITPFILLSDSDPADGNDALDNPNGAAEGCGVVAYSGDPTAVNAVRWAHGTLDKGSDQHDLWDMSFFAPLCSDNYNPETDPISPGDQPAGGLIDPSFCHKGPGPDSDEYTDLASNVRFEVTAFSTPTPTALGAEQLPKTGSGSSPGPDKDWLMLLGAALLSIGFGAPLLYAYLRAGRD